ncbi:MAG: type II toxin-antitoxin system RelE/ParE family toxin [Micrococcales bacterium]|nr:type II toxin-antitoxin system RelE/ParE family toxin [Micrococcales bacterium]MCL2668652.1 type II toxin-antitoxin system RelE/ParE family toxin [Micrococcales bacterium]
MTYSVRLGPSARRDRDRILAWYDVEAPEQSERFVKDLYSTAEQLETFPRLRPVIRRGARRISLEVFPYQLWYRVRDDAAIVQVIAVLHHRQDSSQIGLRV